jgi:hypothetical protein
MFTCHEKLDNQHPISIFKPISCRKHKRVLTWYYFLPCYRGSAKRGRVITSDAQYFESKPPTSHIVHRSEATLFFPIVSSTNHNTC